MERWDGLAYAQQRAIFHARRAKDLLDRAAPSPARETLASLVDCVVTREQ